MTPTFAFRMTVGIALGACGLAFPQGLGNSPERPPATTTTTTVAETPRRPESAAWYVPQREVADCDDALRLALKVGWPPELLAHLGRIMWRESACKAWAVNPRDRAGGSFGLLQINGAHLAQTDWNPRGFLQSRNIGVYSSADLLVAELNLRAGLVLYRYAEDAYGDGWQPWNATRDR